MNDYISGSIVTYCTWHKLLIEFVNEAYAFNGSLQNRILTDTTNKNKQGLPLLDTNGPT